MSGIGGGGGGPGGGGVEYPPYIKNFHSWLLQGEGIGTNDPNLGTDVGLIAAGMIGAAANPYTGVAAYDPDSDLSLMQSRVGDFAGLVDAIDELSLWEEMAEAVLNKIDDLLPDEAAITDEVDAFEEEELLKLGRAYNRVAGGFFDINAVVGTTYPAALAILEAGHRAGIARFRAERTIGHKRERSLVILHSIDEMTKLFSLRLSSSLSSVQAQHIVGGAKIGAKIDQNRTDTSLNLDEAFWDLTVLEHAGGVLGAISGISPVSKGMTQLQSVLSGVMTGASWGIGIGTATGSMELGLVSGLIASVMGGAAALSEFR